MNLKRLRNLNFQHLLYFQTVVREGGIGKAAESLNLSQPTLSAQIKKLERMLGQPLLRRQGRGVAVTSFGQRVYEHADRVFRESERMLDAIESEVNEGQETLVVGIVDSVPKLLSRHLLDAFFDLGPQATLICLENKLDVLAADLGRHRVDVVLADAPLDSRSAIKAFNHELGFSRISLFGTRELIDSYGQSVPSSLDGAPFLFPGEGSALRRSLEHWLESQSTRPNVIAECDDQALIKNFGAVGRGFFVAPTLVADELCASHGVEELLVLPGVRERFFAITTERRVRHPLVARLSKRARQILAS
jgi:LysR family transcriptional activator of nhaA